MTTLSFANKALHRWEGEGGRIAHSDTPDRVNRLAARRRARRGCATRSIRSRATMRKMIDSGKPIAQKRWRMRDPYGKIYEFKNARRFADEHPHLFMDSTPQLVGFGFSSVRTGRKGSWHGWTWAGAIIESLNGHADMLTRGLICTSPLTISYRKKGKSK